ncbi:response regulator [Sunxiuqinia elliptica]|uniref:Response regulator receiver domain-containing protein n=1 Tax=Sunxiuqinia elliptica TaxID=655355 RepID=A0A4R6H1Y1_9BACT|nr:response regulator [Sunxiuqinia elliptica]TDO01275.1 response regulator receiver domain-containing protein [Sunxiuqinia elliptica]TDO57786.1 response regulator receiver domain-containing protein [Sunxiuqinia elliptica]
MEDKLSILLVEDNVLNQRIVTFSLKKYNHEVTIANNGLEAIDRFKESTFDVVLMDLMMPEMDGLEATVKIREIENSETPGSRTPIIALTANTMDNDREKCLSYGMDEFMAKPFDIEKLKKIFLELEIVK